ncbi:MAG: radical SAM protein [Candidatus Hodarchaeota archaeon]
MTYDDNIERKTDTSENVFLNWLEQLPPMKLYRETDKVKVLKPDFNFCISKNGRLVLRKKDSFLPDKDVGTLAALVITLGHFAQSRQNLNGLLRKMLKIDPEKIEDWIERSYSTYRFFLVPLDQGNHSSEANASKILEDVKLILKSKPHFSAITRTKRLSSPLTLNWTATHSCNRYCSYCYIPTTKIGDNPSYKTSKKETLPTERIMEIFDEAKEIGVSRIAILGGEPFMAKDIFKLCQYIKSIGISITVHTKSKVPETLLESFDSSDLLWISLDSCHKNTVCKLTGSNSAYDDMMQSIELAKGKRFLSMVSVVNRQNRSEILETIKMASDLGVSKIRLTQCMRPIHGSNNSYLITTNESKTLYETIRRYYPKMKAGNTTIITDLCISPEWDPAACNKPISYSEAGITPLKGMACSHIIHTLGFDCDGSVYGCHRLRRPTIGNINKSTIMEVWNSSHLSKLESPDREMYRGTICHDCEWFDECFDKNSCIFYSFLAYGRLHMPEPRAFCHRQKTLRRDYKPFYNPINCKTNC